MRMLSRKRACEQIKAGKNYLYAHDTGEDIYQIGYNSKVEGVVFDTWQAIIAKPEHARNQARASEKPSKIPVALMKTVFPHRGIAV